MMRNKGWKGESARHSLAARGQRSKPRKSARSTARDSRWDAGIWHEKMSALIDRDYWHARVDSLDRFSKEFLEKFENFLEDESDLDVFSEIASEISAKKKEAKRRLMEAAGNLEKYNISDDEFDKLNEAIQEAREDAMRW